MDKVKNIADKGIADKDGYAAQKGRYDLLIFGGQSNMEGQTECLPEPNDPVDGALEYFYLKDALLPLKHPVGEDIGDLLGGACFGNGSLVPFFCRAYVKASDRKVIAVHAAKGATTVSEWQPGTPIYREALKKIRGALDKVGRSNIDKIYYMWLQGESDALISTSCEDYLRLLTEYKNALKKDVGIDRFCIIKVGYFCGVVSGVKDRPKDVAIACDETIMKAQDIAAETDSDFVMLTDICPKIVLLDEYVNPFEEGHFNNKAMKLIGETGGKALAELCK